MTTLLITLAVLLAVYVFLAFPRLPRRNIDHLAGYDYAHRGLWNDELPENSLAAFKNAVGNDFGIELDVHVTADDQLVVFHDDTLDRMCGVSGKVADKTLAELRTLRLKSSDHRIPTFDEFLDVVGGKVPLIIEIKSNKRNDLLCSLLWERLQRYDGPYCMESFHPACVFELKKHHPNVIRGQLVMDYFKEDNSKLHPALKWLITNQAENFLTQPDFVSYRYSDRKTFSNFLVRKFWGLQGVSWTIKSQEEFDQAVKEGWLPIFEGFKP